MTKSITSCVIGVLGEIFGQYFKSIVQRTCFTLSLRRLIVFGLYGLVVTGPVLHLWYGLLERVVSRLLDNSRLWKLKTLFKLAIDRLLFGPPFVFLTVVFLQFLQTLSTHRTIEYIRRSYFPVLVMNQKVWTIAQAINFAVIPIDLQVLFVNAVAIGWNTYLSLAN